jgi:hypothetical protein
MMSASTTMHVAMTMTVAALYLDRIARSCHRR